MCFERSDLFQMDRWSAACMSVVGTGRMRSFLLFGAAGYASLSAELCSMNAF